MLTSEIWLNCGYRRPPGQVRVRCRPEGPKDTIFGHANHVHIHELFDFDLDAAKSGKIKRIMVIKNDHIHAGVYVVPTDAKERRAVAKRNLESLRAELIGEYWNQFRLIESSRAGRTTAEQRKDDRYAANRRLQRPLSVEAIKAQWPNAIATYERLKSLEAAVHATEVELASL